MDTLGILSVLGCGLPVTGAGTPVGGAPAMTALISILKIAISHQKARGKLVFCRISLWWTQICPQSSLTAKQSYKLISGKISMTKALASTTNPAMLNFLLSAMSPTLACSFKR